jgi:hypothetical protein
MFVFSFFVLVLTATAHDIPRTASITGVVTDHSGASYSAPSAVILWKNGREVARQVLAADGKFSLAVNPGTYQITVSKIPGAGEYRRAPFEVLARQQFSIHIVPWLRYPVLGLSADGKEYREPARTVRYEGFRAAIQRKDIPVLVRYHGRKQKRSLKIYADAMLTFADWTITAQTLEFDPQTFKISAKGEVSVENGLEMSSRKNESQAIDIKDILSSKPK